MTPARHNATTNSKWTVLAVVGSGIFMSTLDAGMVIVALPTITRAFDVPVVVSQWVVLGYVLCIASLLLPVGRLSDMRGRKAITLVGFVFHAAGALLCGLAPSLGALIVGRVVQGIGGAMMQANSQALIAQVFPATERGRALGLNLAFVSAGFVSGPIVGGVLVDWLGWPWIFFVSVPIALVAALAGARLLDETPAQPDQRFDPAGAVLFMALVIGLLLTLNWGAQQGWSSPAVLALAAATAVTAVGFTLVERRVAQPIIEVGLFRLAGFRAAIVASFLMFLSVSHAFILLPFYLQLVLGMTAAQVGLVLVTQAVTLLVLAPIAGALSDRLGSRLLASVGAAVGAVGMLSLATLGPTSTGPEVAARMVVLAVGMGLFGPPNVSALFGALPRERYGVAGAYQQLTRNLAQAIGQAVAATLWSAVVVAAGGGLAALAAPLAAQMTGFQVVFTVATLFLVAATVVSLLARPGAAVAEPAVEPEPVGHSRPVR